MKALRQREMWRKAFAEMLDLFWQYTDQPFNIIDIQSFTPFHSQEYHVYVYGTLCYNLKNI